MCFIEILMFLPNFAHHDCRIVAIMAWRIHSTVIAGTAVVDFTHNLFLTALQCHLEIWLGIIAANLPTLGPLRVRFFRPHGKAISYSGSTLPSRTGTSHNTHIGRGPAAGLGRDKSHRLLGEESSSTELVNSWHMNKSEAGIANPKVNRSWAPGTNGIAKQVHIDIYSEPR